VHSFTSQSNTSWQRNLQTNSESTCLCAFLLFLYRFSQTEASATYDIQYCLVAELENFRFARFRHARNLPFHRADGECYHTAGERSKQHFNL